MGKSSARQSYDNSIMGTCILMWETEQVLTFSTFKIKSVFESRLADIKLLSDYISE